MGVIRGGGNEPKSIYEVCLYEPLEETQTMKERALGGKDNETQRTGPVGESFLRHRPWGYEEVSERSIHDDISGEGETIHRFFPTEAIRSTSNGRMPPSPNWTSSNRMTH